MMMGMCSACVIELYFHVHDSSFCLSSVLLSDRTFDFLMILQALVIHLFSHAVSFTRALLCDNRPAAGP